MNPFKEISSVFSREYMEAFEGKIPHVFTIVSSAYWALRDTAVNVAILLR
jgi:myosin heavy subunit